MQQTQEPIQMPILQRLFKQMQEHPYQLLCPINKLPWPPVQQRVCLQQSLRQVRWRLQRLSRPPWQLSLLPELLSGPLLQMPPFLQQLRGLPQEGSRYSANPLSCCQAPFNRPLSSCWTPLISCHTHFCSWLGPLSSCHTPPSSCQTPLTLCQTPFSSCQTPSAALRHH